MNSLQTSRRALLSTYAGGAAACLWILAGGSANPRATTIQERSSFGDGLNRLRKASQDDAFETFAFCAVHKATGEHVWSSVEGYATSIAPGHERKAYSALLKAVKISGWKTTDMLRICLHTHPIFLGITDEKVRSGIRTQYRARVATLVFPA